MSRFDIARYAVRNPVLVWLLIVVTIGGGLLGYGRIEQLEDPAFTIRQAVVVTLYPGANAEQVEREVTDVLESAIQRMSQLEEIRSISRAGYSEIRVEIRDTFSGEVLPQIWSELRHKVGDAQGELPAGATRRWSTTISAMCSASTTRSPATGSTIPSCTRRSRRCSAAWS